MNIEKEPRLETFNDVLARTSNWEELSSEDKRRILDRVHSERTPDLETFVPLMERPPEGISEEHIRRVQVSEAIKHHDLSDLEHPFRSK